jgi:thiamine-monophosphate kinase
MNEFEFIRHLRDQMQSRGRSTRVIKGIGDDATVICEIADRDLVVTTDLLIQGIDFHREATPAHLLGHKALAVSLSDVAAMGARPRWGIVSLGLPTDVWATDFKDSLFQGYFALADTYGVELVGGDISQAEHIIIDSIVAGEVSSGGAVLRSTAQPGDQIYVTGTLGAAAAGLKLIEMGARVNQTSEVRGQRPEHVTTQRSEIQSELTNQNSTVEPPPTASGLHYNEETSEAETIHRLLLRQLQPQPRVGWGIVLGEEQLATSMIDISDGLSSDLHHLCEESKVGAALDAERVPMDEDVQTLCGRRALDPLSLALHGGEDFELLFTVRPENVSRLPKRVDGIQVSLIGEITANAGLWLHERDRVWEFKPQGFTHFAEPR